MALDQEEGDFIVHDAPLSEEAGHHELLPVLQKNHALDKIDPDKKAWAALSAQAQQYPILSEAEEHHLVVQLSLNEDVAKQAAQQLVLHHLRLVLASVRRYSGYGLPAVDLAQEGVIGLMMAIKKYNPGVGVRLGVYAKIWVDAAIKNFILHHWRLVKLGGGKVWKKLFFGYRSGLSKLEQMNPEMTTSELHRELSEKMKVPVKQLEQMSSYLQSSVELEDLGEGNSLSDSNNPEKNLEGAQDEVAKQKLLALVAELPVRQKEVVVARFLKNPPSTLQELGLAYDLTPERVRQIEKQALTALQIKAKKLGFEILQ